jgi:acetyl esterase/lipase
MRRKILLFVLLCAAGTIINAQEIKYETRLNIPYYSESINRSDKYLSEQCLLDIYYPQNQKKFATIIWFYGGGFKTGKKYFPQALLNKGFCIVAPDYRHSPMVKSPKFIEDGAAAVAWVFKNIESYGGDASQVFVAGHSSGAYLVLMIGLDTRWLGLYNIDANKIAGLISCSGQTITPFIVREERDIPKTRAIVDDLAPLYYVRADAPPLLLITGDRELENFGRYEENAYMLRMLKIVGHKESTLYELDGYGHSMTEPAFPLLLNEVRRITEKNKTPRPQ